MQRWLTLPIFIVFLLSAACTQPIITASRAQTADLSAVKNLYVVHFEKDNRGVNTDIKNGLLKLGFQASTGPRTDVPQEADAIVTYEDRWIWDLSMYMVSLQIQVRDRDYFPLAAGQSFRASMDRSSPDAMAFEVLEKIFPGKTEQK